MTDLSKMTMEELIDEICDHIKESCVECTYDHALAQQELEDRIALLEAVREAVKKMEHISPEVHMALAAIEETKETP